jgi:hypothetical protein
MTETLARESEASVREIVFNREHTYVGIRFDTNLPDGVDPFINTTRAYDLDETYRYPRNTLTIDIPGMDNLPIGNFYVSRQKNHLSSGEWLAHRAINVYETTYGKAVGIEAFGLADVGDITSIGPDEKIKSSEGILVDLGFVVSSNDEADTIASISGVPTSETLKHAANLLGVEIDLIRGVKVIPPSRYLSAFADRKYPVALGDEEAYLHDIGPDHLPALIVGGEKIKDVLSEVATKALRSNNQVTIEYVTGRIDYFTSTLSSIVFGSSAKDKLLVQAGKELGISGEDVDSIITTAKNNGVKYTPI